jgi:hypothetical protein
VPISTFLNNRVPTRLRGLQFLALSDSAAIQRRTAATDNGGAATWTWATISTVPCRVYPLTPRGQSRLTGGALDEKTTHYLTAPLGTDVGTSDRVVIAGKGTFDVTMVVDRTDQLTRLIEVMQA